MIAQPIDIITFLKKLFSPGLLNIIPAGIKVAIDIINDSGTNVNNSLKFPSPCGNEMALKIMDKGNTFNEDEKPMRAGIRTTLIKLLSTPPLFSISPFH
ncbi:hypothetical protein [Tatumella terrea]|uniref:Uncharacterized protein n=1 Tax=Tatumella terrea TaxID=419007 RepID=A0ABW1VX39_9GAMM